MFRGKGKTYTCEVCRNSYYVTPIEIRFYSTVDVKLPNQCRICARKAREAKAQAAPSPTVIARTSNG